MQSDIQQAAAAGACLASVDHLVQDLLLGDHIAQPVAAQQQKVPFVQLLPEQIGPQLRVRAQSAGNEILMGMGSGLVGGQLASLHQILHQRVVTGHPDDAALLGEVVGAAVSLVEDQGLPLLHQSGHHGGAHPGAVRFSNRAAEDLFIGGGRRALHPAAVRQAAAALVLQKFPHEDVHRHGTGHISCLGSAHAVAHQGHHPPVGQDLVGKGVLILCPDHTAVGDTPHIHGTSSFLPAALGPPLRSLACSPMALRRSCPQEASMSLPSRRRTVTVTPWLSRRF